MVARVAWAAVASLPMSSSICATRSGEECYTHKRVSKGRTKVKIGGEGARARGFAACRAAYLFDGSPNDEEGSVFFLAPREGRREDAISENSAERDKVHQEHGVGIVLVFHLAKSTLALCFDVALDVLVAGKAPPVCKSTRGRCVNSSDRLAPRGRVAFSPFEVRDGFADCVGDAPPCDGLHKHGVRKESAREQRVWV